MELENMEKYRRLYGNLRLNKPEIIDYNNIHDKHIYIYIQGNNNPVISGISADRKTDKSRVREVGSRKRQRQSYTPEWSWSDMNRETEGRAVHRLVFHERSRETERQTNVD